MRIYTTAALAAFLLSACMATTPTQGKSVSTAIPGELIELAWFCYGSSYDAEYETHNWIFYAYTGGDLAYVNIHGEDRRAEFSMDGLDATFAFDWDENLGHYTHGLIIEADGDSKYVDIYMSPLTETLLDSLSALYSCRKAQGSR